MRNRNVYEVIERATTKYTNNLIISSIKATGIDCILYRKNKDRVTDKVYGIYGGSDLSRTPSTSIYDKPITAENIDDVDLFEHNIGQETNLNLEQSIDDSYEELVRVRVLLNTMQWRAISNQSASFLTDDPGYVYCIAEIPIEHGDVLLIDSDTHQVKFKVYYPELIGNYQFSAYRFRITNVQE